MTREERHIAVLNRMLENMDVYDSIQPTTERKKAIKAAIKALEQQPCDNAISRQAVLDVINNNRFRYTVAKEDACTGNVLWDSDLIDSNVVQDISSLPSVTPKSETVTEFADRCRECGAKYGKLLEQKYGKWIVHEKPHGIRYLECQYCNTWYLNEHLIRNSYCPNCGSYNGGNDNGNE